MENTNTNASISVPTLSGFSQTKAKQHFRHLFSFLLNNISWEQLENAGLHTIYPSAISYYQTKVGSTGHVVLDSTDYAILEAALTPLEQTEIALRVGISLQALKGRYKKLFELVLIQAFKQNGKTLGGASNPTYYQTTLEGKQQVEQWVARGRSIL